MFILVEVFTKTGALRALSGYLYQLFGANLLPVSIALLAGVGLASSMLANIPVVAAMIILVKGYLVSAEFVPEDALGVIFHRLAHCDPSGLCGNDVRRDPGRECNAHRGFGQCG